MTYPVLFVESPLEKNYCAFWSSALRAIPKSTPGIDVLVKSHVASSFQLNAILLSLYPQIRHATTELGFSHVFEIDILVNRAAGSWKTVYVLESEQLPSHFTGSVEFISATTTAANLDLAGPDFKPKEFSTSAVGGTFDHLHDGHKILLQMTMFVASRRVIVGVTGPQLLVNKKFSEVLEPLDRRVSLVCKYLQKNLDAGVDFNIYQINDICGPTGFVKEIDALVISQETAKGAAFVNDYRKKQGFPELEIITVAVIGGDGSGNAENNWKGKLSSTDLREEEYLRLRS